MKFQIKAVRFARLSEVNLKLHQRTEDLNKLQENSLYACDSGRSRESRHFPGKYGDASLHSA
jgi:hypothetical protein